MTFEYIQHHSDTDPHAPLKDLDKRSTLESAIKSDVHLSAATENGAFDPSTQTRLGLFCLRKLVV